MTYACPFLRIITEIMKNVKVYMVLGDAVSTLDTFLRIATMFQDP